MAEHYKDKYEIEHFTLEADRDLHRLYVAMLADKRAKRLGIKRVKVVI